MMLCAGFKKEPEGFHIQDEGDRRLYRKFQTYSLYAILYGESLCLPVELRDLGKLHWITGDGSNRNGMWFNPGDETFGNVALPNPSGDTFNWKLVSSAGNLCMTCDYRNKTHVWIMKEYGLAESWTIVASTPKFVNKVIWLIFSSQNDEILLLDISGLVWWYVSRDDDTFERPENQTLCECDGCGALSLYVESLVSPNSPFDR
ncbi:putative hippocampus abundant transcript-like protein 1-like [Capsicum annuum]|nr:putative hippocampus abundant transcript-like protein 1-like [Capsicum annuum]